MSLDFETGTDLMNMAIKKEQEDHLWEEYSLMYPGMDQNTFITFEQYKRKAYNSISKPQLNKDEIIAEAEKIRRLDQGIIN